MMPQFKDENAKRMYEKLWLVGSSGGEAPLPTRAEISASISYMAEVVPDPLIRVVLAERDRHMALQLLNCPARRIVG